MTSVSPDWDAVGFQEGSYKLATTSPYYRAGDDGKDPGVDVDALMAAQDGPASSGCGQAAANTARRPNRRP